MKVSDFAEVRGVVLELSSVKKERMSTRENTND